MLHDEMKAAGKTVDDIKKITIRSTEATIRIISKQGKLNNYADRDHCIQYMVAVPLIEGALNPEHYNDDYAAATPKIDELRSKTYVEEVEDYSRGYLEPSERSIANDVHIEFNDGTKMNKEIIYPVGHARRRDEAKPLIKAKLEKHLKGQFENDKDADAIVSLLNDHAKVTKMPVNEFVDLWKPSKLVKA